MTAVVDGSGGGHEASAAAAVGRSGVAIESDCEGVEGLPLVAEAYV